MRVIFNVRYLAVIDMPDVALEFAFPARPALLKQIGHLDETALYQYMPMPMPDNR